MSSSKSKSATSSNTSYTTDTTNLNLQDVRESSVAVGTGNTVNTMDGGAINKAFDFGGRALAANEGAMDTAFDFGRRTLELNTDIVGRVLTQGSRATENAMQMIFDSSQPDQAANKNLTQTAMLAAAVIGATVLVAKGLK
jgi:hypothetical protein